VDKKRNIIQEFSRSRLARTCANLLGHVLTEWQIFIRTPNGRGHYIVVKRSHQLAVLAIFIGLGIWAGVSNLMLMRRPAEIAERVEQLDNQIAKLHEAEKRLTATRSLVADLEREVADVHANLTVLTDTNAQLIRDREPSGKILPPAKLEQSLGALLDDPATDNEPSSVRKTRDGLRQLRASLDRLHDTYARAVNQTASLADEGAGEIEKSLGRAGVKAEEILHSADSTQGQGGPFIPVSASGDPDRGVAYMLDRLSHWNEIKATAVALPLAEPLREEWEINSPFGARHDPINADTGIHEGIDMGAPYGTPVYATGMGRVKMAGYYDRYGNAVDVDHGNGFVTRYAHLAEIKVRPGQHVTRATVIGLLGSSGRTTGAHLHYEIRVNDTPRNPLIYILAGRDASKTR